jgi:hypothetical protein
MQSFIWPQVYHDPQSWGFLFAVFLLTSAQVKATPRPIEELEQLPAE